MCVRLLRTGSDSERISCDRVSPAGRGIFLISFFFAAMIPLSVA